MIDRRHMTELSDDEVMLLDALWDGDCALWMLQQAHYQATTDLPYCHRYTDEQLLEALSSLTERGLLRAYLYVYAETDDKRYYGLSQEGGAYWELERKPDWDAYVYSDERDGLWSVESASLATAYDYARWAYDAGWGAPHWQTLTQIEKPMYRFFPWADFPLVYELCGEAQAKTYQLNWDDYHERRTWWLDIPELLDL
ncbi:MAG: hypothetical protein AAFV93_02065 [Chloroflexota bacterium]